MTRAAVDLEACRAYLRARQRRVEAASVNVVGTANVLEVIL